MTSEPDSGPRRSVVGLVVAVVLAAVMLLAPAPEGLSERGWRLAAVFVVTLVLFTTEAVPVAVTSLLAVVLQPILGVATLPAAATASMSPVFYFVIAMFAIAQAFVSTGLDRRFAFWLLARAGTDSRRVLGALMLGAAVLSTVVSDVPTTALFMAIALGLFERAGLERGGSRFAKSVMLGIPIAAFIGGVATPAGTSINVLGLAFLERHGGVTVPFLHWMAIGVPMVILLLPVAWWAILRFYPPEVATVGTTAELDRDRAALGPLRTDEVKVLGLLGAMLALWIASTWVRQLDVALVALAGAVVMFLPGFRLFGWKDLERSTGWDALLMIAGVTSIGAASAETGLARWLVDHTLTGLPASPAAVVAIVAAFTILIRLFLPMGPVIVAVVVPPLALLAKDAGVNPALYTLPVVFTASCAFLLPLDAVTLVTFSRGYYGMLDMFKPGLVISLAWVVVITAVVAVVGPLLGLF